MDDDPSGVERTDMELALRIFRSASRRWNGLVCEGDAELAWIEECASPHEVVDIARDQFPMIRVVKHSQTPARVVAALEGRDGGADGLDDDERELFDELLGEALDAPSAESEAFYAKLREQGGGVGYDDQDRLVRGLPGGGVEVIEEPHDSES